MDLVPLVDLMLIGLFFGIFHSQFLLPPGLTIELPQAPGQNLSPSPVAAVVTVLPVPAEQGARLVLFRGDILPVDRLAPALESYLAERRLENPVLLVKIDRKADLDQLAAVANAARASGFVAVQVAAEQEQGEQDELFAQ